MIRSLEGLIQVEDISEDSTQIIVEEEPRVMASAVGLLNASWVEFLSYPGGSYKLFPPKVFRVALKMYCSKDVYCPPGSHPRACPSCPTGVLDPLLVFMPSGVLEVISHVLLVTIGLRTPYRMRRKVLSCMEARRFRISLEPTRRSLLTCSCIVTGRIRTRQWMCQ